jgi:hypothetical protein
MPQIIDSPTDFSFPLFVRCVSAYEKVKVTRRETAAKSIFSVKDTRHPYLIHTFLQQDEPNTHFGGFPMGWRGYRLGL